MDAIAAVLEHELEEAFEVKNKKSLHRYVMLLADNIVKKENYEKDQSDVRSDIAILAENMKLGFERTDQRFEEMNQRFEAMQIQMDRRFDAVDKRFDAVDKRFSMMFVFMNIGMSLIILMTILFKFVT